MVFEDTLSWALSFLTGRCTIQNDATEELLHR